LGYLQILDEMIPFAVRLCVDRVSRSPGRRLDTVTAPCCSAEVLEFTVEDVSAEEIARLRAIYEPLAESVRDLVDATIRTEADAETVAAVKADIDAAVARLRSKQIDGAFGVRRTTSGESMGWGNAVIASVTPSPRRWRSTASRTAGDGPTSILVRLTRDHPGTCTAGCPH
jgi:hypothetical protein